MRHGGRRLRLVTIMVIIDSASVDRDRLTHPQVAEHVIRDISSGSEPTGEDS